MRSATMSAKKSSFETVVLWFDIISNPLVYDLSEVVLTNLFMTKTKKKVVSRSRVVLI